MIEWGAAQMNDQNIERVGIAAGKERSAGRARRHNGAETAIEEIEGVGGGIEAWRS